MGEVTSKQTKLAETAVAKANVIAKKSTLTKKIALTKKLEQTEKQIIVTQGQTKQTSLAEGKFLSYQYNDQIFVHGGRCVELVDSNIVSTAHSAFLRESSPLVTTISSSISMPTLAHKVWWLTLPSLPTLGDL